MEGEGDDFTGRLYAEELVAVGGASEGRLREFAAGRECARRALAQLGIGGLALPLGPRGAPVWPRGIVGSITHKGTYRAAAVAREDELEGIGIDAELDAPLPNGVLATIALPDELERVDGLAIDDPLANWDRLLFSAKEAAVKSADPLAAGTARLRETRIRIGPNPGEISAWVYDRQRPIATCTGRWVSTGDLVLVAVSASR